MKKEPRVLLTDEEKKQTIAVCVHPLLAIKINELYKNKSKYIESLIYKDLLNKKLIEEILL